MSSTTQYLFSNYGFITPYNRERGQYKQEIITFVEDEVYNSLINAFYRSLNTPFEQSLKDVSRFYTRQTLDNIEDDISLSSPSDSEAITLKVFFNGIMCHQTINWLSPTDESLICHAHGVSTIEEVIAIQQDLAEDILVYYQEVISEDMYNLIYSFYSNNNH